MKYMLQVGLSCLPHLFGWAMELGGHSSYQCMLLKNSGKKTYLDYIKIS